MCKTVTSWRKQAKTRRGSPIGGGRVREMCLEGSRCRVHSVDRPATLFLSGEVTNGCLAPLAWTPFAW